MTTNLINLTSSLSFLAHQQDPKDDNKPSWLIIILCAIYIEWKLQQARDDFNLSLSSFECMNKKKTMTSQNSSSSSLGAKKKKKKNKWQMSFRCCFLELMNKISKDDEEYGARRLGSLS
jgi:hypothetical protein